MRSEVKPLLREYKRGDYEKLHTNEFTTAEYVRDIMATREFKRRTMEANGEPRAIIMFNHLEGAEWYGLFIIPVNFTSFDAKWLRRYTHDLMDEFQAQMVWTASRCGEIMDRWHKFMRMERFGDTQIIDGRDCQVWRLRHGN